MHMVDEFWSNLLEELQAKSIPTFSLVSQFGFPLALRDDEFVIGCMKDNHQKMLENKAEHIKVAAKRLLGKELFIKVKVQAGGAPEGAPKPAPQPRRDGPTPAPSQREPQPSAVGNGAAGDSEVESEPEPALADVATLSTQPEERKKREIPLPESGEAIMVKEAYRLFEGPGSRQIG